MLKPTPHLLRFIEALRPKDYRCSIVNPAGLVTHEAQFATEAEAKKWTVANRCEGDMAMVHFTNSAVNN
jgi:hypothetical protein